MSPGMSIHFKHFMRLAVIALLFCSWSQAQEPSPETQAEKSASPQQAAWGDLGDGTFRNPVLLADYNNLDVIRVGQDFYMISASHHFMGMPVLHSKDMVNWTLIARISRELKIHDRYDTPGQAYQHGTWAPAIRFHDGKFFVYVCTPQEGCCFPPLRIPLAHGVPGNSCGRRRTGKIPVRCGMM